MAYFGCLCRPIYTFPSWDGSRYISAVGLSMARQPIHVLAGLQLVTREILENAQRESRKGTRTAVGPGGRVRRSNSQWA